MTVSTKDWNQLISAGVPLAADSRAVSTGSWPRLAAITLNATISELTLREEQALRAWLIALRDHYQSTFSKYFDDPIITGFINKAPIDGKLIKLRRIASSLLAKVA